MTEDDKRTASTRKLISTLNTINDEVQSLHPEVVGVVIASILKRHVGSLTQQLVDELESKISRCTDANGERSPSGG